MSSEQTQAQQQSIESVMALLGQAVTGSLEERLNTLEQVTLDRLAELESHAERAIKKERPILHIKIDDIERELSTRAVPYLKQMIVNAKVGIHTMLVGPAGCGKTTAAKQLGEALKLQFATVTLTAGASETWLFGRQTPNGFVNGAFAELYENGGVFLADEYDAADANLLLSINTALANGTLFNPMNGKHIKRHDDFVFVAACNTFGKGTDHVYTGRNRLDAASLDRFVGGIIEIDYDSEFEREICGKNIMLYDALAETRQKFRSEHLTEVLSTRAFEHAALLLDAKTPVSTIIKSLTAPMTEEAAKIVKDCFRNSAKKYKDNSKDKDSDNSADSDDSSKGGEK